MAATVEAAGGVEARRPIVVYVLDHLVWGILAAILLVCSVTIEHFFQIGIFLNIAQHATFVGLLAIGLSFCIIAGHMDLSIESVMAFAAMLAAWLTASRGSPLGIQLNTWLTLLIVLGFGALVGLFNAVLVVRFRINAFIVTLATYISVRGLGLILTGGRSMYGLPDDFRAAGSSDLLGLPLLIWILVVTYLIFGAVLKKTQFGRWVYPDRRQSRRPRSAPASTSTACSIACSSSPAWSPPSPASCSPPAPTAPRPISASACCSRCSPPW